MIGLRTTFTTRQICIYGVVASILFSMTVLLQHDLLNGDGILYVRVAKLLQNGQFSDAIALYGWPFFSVLIAAVDLVTGVGLDASAYILVTLFDAALLVAFILIIKELGGDARVQIAAIVVVFSLAYMNENRADVIRDHGYWTCYLFSLLLFLKFYKSPGLWLGLWWSVTILLGALFRIEGFIVWAVLPLILLFRSNTSAVDKLRHLFKAYLLLILIGIFLVVYLWITKDASFLATRLGDYKLLFGIGTLDGLGVDMVRRISVLETEVLDANYSSEFARASIVGIILIILGSKVLTTITPPYVVTFFIPSLRARLKELDPRLIRVIAWAGIINLVVILSFLIPRFFLSARWVLPFSFTLLLFVPFMLVQVLDNWRKNRDGRQKRSTALYLIFTLFVLYGFLDGLITTSPSKTYVKDAAVWIKQNLDRESAVYTNDPRVDHYSGRYKGPSGDDKLRPNQWRKYDYIAIFLERDDMDGVNAIDSKANCLSEIKQFSGPRKAMIRIFRVNHDNDCDYDVK